MSQGKRKTDCKKESGFNRRVRVSEEIVAIGEVASCEKDRRLIGGVPQTKG